jgi:predicted aspartyl protease
MAWQPLTPSLLGLVALLGACADPAVGAPRQAQPECVFAETAAIPLRGDAGLRVAATLNGEPLTLEVNTGLGLTSLQPHVVQRLRLPEDPRNQSSHPGPDGPVTRRNVQSRSLRVGEREWSERSLAVRPFFGADGPLQGFDGVLAADLLRQTELEIDLPTRRLALHRAENCRAGNPPWAPAVAVTMEVRGLGVPVITVHVNGQAVRARIQSGNSATTVTEALATRLALDRPTGRRARTYGSDPAARRGREYLVDEMVVGEEVLRNQPVVVSADLGGPEEELILGQDWLRHRKVWLSFANRRLFLARPGG